MPGGRGPAGTAGPPPADLAMRKLPLVEVAASRRLVRIHRTAHDPVHFGPGPGMPPTYRFDPNSGRFGVLYAAFTLEGAFFETLLRTPGQRLVAYPAIAVRSCAFLAVARALRLVDLTGPGLSVLGLDAAIFAGPYAPCGAWADALFDHPDEPDGIAYRSRHNPQETCVALFERSGIMVETLQTRPLSESDREIGAILDGAGKAIVY